jgi:hypothetical protein
VFRRIIWGVLIISFAANGLCVISFSFLTDWWRLGIIPSFSLSRLILALLEWNDASPQNFFFGIILEFILLVLLAVLFI